MEFATPWAFLLVCTIPALLLLRHYKRRPSLSYPSTSLLPSARSLRTRIAALPFWCRLVCLLFLTFALARPREGTERTEERTNGVAIEMVLDRSSSMSELMEFEGKPAERFAIAKHIFRSFILGGDGLEGRPHDLVGVIAYARFAETICPLTLSHDALPGILKQLHLVHRGGEEDRTAILDGIALALARLEQAESELAAQTPAGDTPSLTLKSKVIIVLTDGQDNASTMDESLLVARARDAGVSIYCIGLAGQDQVVHSPIFGPRRIRGDALIDKRLLNYLAEKTGGLFYVANSPEGLKAIYQQIDELEKSEIRSTRYVDYKEAFSPLAWIALCFLGLEILLASTWLRRAP